jgi:histidine ammonia-lyase
LDFLSIALSELGNIAERRIDNLVNCRDKTLPPGLVKGWGLNSGFMLTQYLAASLVSENKVLSHPVSVDSIPTSAGQEDFVSMGTIAGRKAKEILKNVKEIIGIELLCACQAIDFHDPIKLGEGTKVAYNLLRDKVSKLETDRVISPDIKKAVELIGNSKLLKSVEKSIGKLI